MSSAGKCSVVLSVWDFTVVTSNWGTVWAAAEVALLASWRQDVTPRQIARRAETDVKPASFITSPSSQEVESPEVEKSGVEKPFSFHKSFRTFEGQRPDFFAL
jgi:hypothetical protein